MQETETETTPTININKQKKGILMLSHTKRNEKKRSPPPKKKNAEENLQEIMAKNIKFPLTEGEVTRTEREIRPRAFREQCCEVATSSASSRHVGSCEWRDRIAWAQV